jgi:hypothetical protein
VAAPHGGGGENRHRRVFFGARELDAQIDCMQGSRSGRSHRN